MACKESDHVCRKYVLLKPKEATLAELVRLLFRPKLGERSFVECSEEEGQKPRGFRRRWLIFVSIVAQKLLLFLREPMAIFGLLLMRWLNFVKINGGLIAIFVNLFKGQTLMKAEKSLSASILGNLDPRMELDKNIKSDDEKYLGSISMMASKLSYENQDFIRNIVVNGWKMQFLGFFNFWNGYLGKTATPAFMCQDSVTNPKLIVLAFRGTDPFDADAFRTDLDISWYKLENVGKIHGGFIKALGLQQDNTWPPEIADRQLLKGQEKQHFAYYEIKKLLKVALQENKETKFIVTGHSLGGALAILFVAGLAIHDEAFLLEKLEGVYTFGQPRVGDEKFGNFVKQKLHEFNVKYRRYVYCYDIVPRIPYDDKTLLFKHFGPCLYFNSLYKGKVLPEEPDKNYFSVIRAGPKYLNSVWELIRGFIIPYVKGSEYKEGFLMKLFRLVGLLIPGLSAHGPYDYVNLTRLGSLPSLTDLHHQDPIVLVSKVD